MTVAPSPSAVRAIYQSVDPAMASAWLADGRGDLLCPAVLWRLLPNGEWGRLSGVVEASLARRWLRSWSRGYVLAITSAHRLSSPVNLPPLD